MHHRSELEGGEPAPETDLYEELNVFGRPTGLVVSATKGAPLPKVPRGFKWRRVATEQERWEK